MSHLKDRRKNHSHGPRGQRLPDSLTKSLMEVVHQIGAVCAGEGQAINLNVPNCFVRYRDRVASRACPRCAHALAVEPGFRAGLWNYSFHPKRVSITRDGLIEIA